MRASLLADASAESPPTNKQRRFTGRSERLDLAPHQSKCADLRELFRPIPAFATTAAVLCRARMRTYEGIARAFPAIIECRQPFPGAEVFFASIVSHRKRWTVPDRQVGRTAKRKWRPRGEAMAETHDTECDPAKADRPHEAAGKRTNGTGRNRTSGPRPRAARRSRREPAGR
jgi:hypothetical protein